MRIAVLYSYAPQAGIIGGFKALGYEVESFFYGIDKVSLYQRIKWKFFKTQDRFLTKNFNKQIDNIFTEHLKANFDILLIIKGKKATQKSKSLLKKMNSTSKILWTTDSVERFPHQLSVKDLVDKVFVQDGDDVKFIENSEWLPLGFDETIYKISDEKNIDILLFGNCDTKFYSNRVAYFLEASKLGDKFTIKFIGSNLDDRAKKILIKNNVEIIRTLSFKDFANKISRSKIAINIHQDDGSKAINPLFFAIPGSRTVQVTNNKEYYKSWLAAEKGFFPVEKKDLNKKLESIISDYNNFKLSKEYLDKINKVHTYKGRALKLLGKNE